MNRIEAPQRAARREIRCVVENVTTDVQDVEPGQGTPGVCSCLRPSTRDGSHELDPRQRARDADVSGALP